MRGSRRMVSRNGASVERRFSVAGAVRLYRSVFYYFSFDFRMLDRMESLSSKQHFELNGKFVFTARMLLEEWRRGLPCGHEQPSRGRLAPNERRTATLHTPHDEPLFHLNVFIHTHHFNRFAFDILSNFLHQYSSHFQSQVVMIIISSVSERNRVKMQFFQ